MTNPKKEIVLTATFILFYGIYIYLWHEPFGLFENVLLLHPKIVRFYNSTYIYQPWHLDPYSIHSVSIYYDLNDTYKQIYNLTSEFKSKLNKYISKAPININTNNPQLMITIFNEKQYKLALNLLCSSQITKTPELFHLFIATDKESYENMRQFKKELILFDIEERNYTYENYCKIKLFLIYYLLSVGVETTICDADIIFLKNPMNLFEENSIIEWSPEGKATAFDHKKPPFEFHRWNVGFMRIKPCLASLLILQKWIFLAIPDSQHISQVVLHQMLRCGVISSNSPIQTYYLLPIVGIPGFLTARFYNPLEVVNGGIANNTLYEQDLKKMNIEKPTLVHAAYYKNPRKIPFFRTNNLYLLENDTSKCPNLDHIPFYGFKKIYIAEERV